MKTLKNIIPVIFGLLIVQIVDAQQFLPTKTQVNNFLKSRTYFVFDNNIFGTYNTAIEEAARKHWKITKFDFINDKEFNRKKKSPGASVIVQTDSHFEGQENLGKFNSLSLLLGKQGATNANSMPDIVTLPLAYADVDYDKYYYKLGIALVYMQRHIQWLRENPNVEDKVLLNHYKSSKKNTKDKILYLLKSEMAKDINTVQQIKQVYSGEVKFVTQAEIEDAVNRKDGDILLLHLVAPAKAVRGSVVTKMILDAKNAEIYYFDFHRVKGKKQPNKFLKSDFKKMENIE